jgi:hypothetical protein
LVIAYSSSSRRAMDGWNSAVSSSKMTSKLWPRRRRPISAGLRVQCRSVGQQPAFFLLLSLSSIFLHRSKENKRTQNKTGPLVFVVDFLLILSNPGHLAFHPIAIHTMCPPAPVLFFFFLLYV